MSEPLSSHVASAEFTTQFAHARTKVNDIAKTKNKQQKERELLLVASVMVAF